MSQINAVVDYIFSSETITTVIGQKMKQAAIVKSQPVDNITKQKENEYQETIHDICTYDSQDCLCWIDYRSWMTMPKRLQNSIQEFLNPKAWRGMIFHFDQWGLHEQDVLKDMNRNIVLVLALDQKKYRIYTIPLYKSYLDWMSPVRFKELSLKMNKTAIKTYGRVLNKIYVLDVDDNIEQFTIVPG